MIKNILKGAVMGLANIIPGVSGGTMAVSMGIYDKLIHCITHLVKELKQSIAFLVPIGIGMVLAIAGSAFGITYLFERFPLQTNFLFIGLILGGLPAVWGKIKGNKILPGHIVSCLAFLGIIIGMAMFGESEGTVADLSFNIVNVLKLFGIGVIASATMVIPGVSGSMMLLVLGYYNPILDAVRQFITDLTQLNIEGLFQGVGILLPFGLGILIGIVAIAKGVEYVFLKAPLYAYWSIVGLILASPIAILLISAMPMMSGDSVLLQGVTGVVALGVGYAIALKLGQ